jgi:hypothetical protein
MEMQNMESAEEKPELEEAVVMPASHLPLKTSAVCPGTITIANHPRVTLFILPE